MDWLFTLDYHHWLLFGLALLVLDMFWRGPFLMWQGLAALAIGALLLGLPLVGVHLSWDRQLALYLFAVAIAWWFWRRHMREPDAIWLGGETPLTQAIENGIGEITLAGRAYVVVGPELPCGTPVRLESIEGMAFRVVAVESADS